MADLDILPTWAANYLNDNILEHAHVLNALPVDAGPNRGTYILNTSRGAMMLQKSRVGDPRHWLLPMPGERHDFVCEVCNERMGFVNPQVPRIVYCSHCATAYTLMQQGDVLALVRQVDDTAPESAPSAPSTATGDATTGLAATVSDFYSDFQGDVHPVLDVEGIGAVYALRLENLGVHTTARLCYEDTEGLARRLDVPAKTVASWQAMAELMKVKGVGPQYAEALVRAGVGGIDALRRRKADRIAATVNTYLDGLESNVLGQKVTARRVASWQKAAADMRRVRQPVPGQ